MQSLTAKRVSGGEVITSSIEKVNGRPTNVFRYSERGQIETISRFVTQEVLDSVKTGDSIWKDSGSNMIHLKNGRQYVLFSLDDR
jgi:hypothetical protein